MHWMAVQRVEENQSAYVGRRNNPHSIFWMLDSGCCVFMQFSASRFPNPMFHFPQTASWIMYLVSVHRKLLALTMPQRGQLKHVQFSAIFFIYFAIFPHPSPPPSENPIVWASVWILRQLTLADLDKTTWPLLFVLNVVSFTRQFRQPSGCRNTVYRYPHHCHVVRSDLARKWCAGPIR
jgi:hypothetical protein